LRDRDTGRSLTPHPGRVGLVLGPEDPAVLDRVLVLGPAPADLVLVGQGDRVEVMGRVAPGMFRKEIAQGKS